MVMSDAPHPGYRSRRRQKQDTDKKPEGQGEAKPLEVVVDNSSENAKEATPGTATTRVSESRQPPPDVEEDTLAEVLVAKNLTEPLQPALSADCWIEIDNALSAAHNSARYDFTNAPDVVRAALKAYWDDMPIKDQQIRPGLRERRHIYLTPTDYARYRKDFDPLKKLKGQVLERIVLAFVANGLQWNKPLEEERGEEGS